jgi:hypothetical protein
VTFQELYRARGGDPPPSQQQQSSTQQSSAEGAARLCLEPHQAIGTTRCFGPSTHNGVATHLARFNDVVRVVGGIPERHIMHQASKCLVPFLAAQAQHTAYLIGCTLTLAPNGTEISSVPNEGIKLQKVLEVLDPSSMVFGTLPGDGSMVDDGKLLLRCSNPSRNSTFMHPELGYGLLFDGREPYTWNNEAIGVASLLDKTLSLNPQLRYRAIFIGGGEATKRELLETMRLSRKFPGQIQALVLWDTGGVSRIAAGRLAGTNVFRATLTEQGLSAAWRTMDDLGHHAALGSHTERMIRGRVFQILGGRADPVAITAMPIVAPQSTSLCHMIGESCAVTGQAQLGGPSEVPYRIKQGTKTLTDHAARLALAASAARRESGTSNWDNLSRYAALELASQVVQSAAGRLSVGPCSHIQIDESIVDPTNKFSPSSVLDVEGVRYAVALDLDGMRTLVHTGRFGVHLVSPQSLMGCRMTKVADLRFESLSTVSLSNVPNESPRWNTIRAGTKIHYLGISSSEPVCTEEILSIQASDRGSHYRIVTSLRTTADGESTQLITGERTEFSLVNPPREIVGAVESRVYCPIDTARGGEQANHVPVERREPMRTADLEQTVKSVLAQTVIMLADEYATQLLRSDEKAHVVRDVLLNAVQQGEFDVRARVERIEVLVRSWCCALEFSGSTAGHAYAHKATQTLRRSFEASVHNRTSVEQSIPLRELYQLIQNTPDSITIRAEILEQLRQDLVGLLDSLHEYSGQIGRGFSFKTYRGEVVPLAILIDCHAIAESRRIKLTEHTTDGDIKEAYQQGGLLYNDYTPEYLQHAIDRGAMLVTLQSVDGATITASAFCLIFPEGTSPAHTQQLLPLVRAESDGYLDVVLGDTGKTRGRSLTLAHALLQTSNTKTGSLLAIVHESNFMALNLGGTHGFLLRPNGLRLINPAGGEEQCYRVLERPIRSSVAEASSKLTVESALVASSNTHGYLHAQPAEFQQMSRLVASTSGQPATTLSLGVESLSGEALDSFNAFINAGALRGLDGIICQTLTGTIERSDPMSDGPAQDSHKRSVMWRMIEHGASSAIRRVYAERAETSLTVSVCPLDPRDPLAGQAATVTALSGSDQAVMLMRGNDTKRTVVQSGADHTILCRVRFPTSETPLSIWNIAARRRLELSALTDNRMIVFAGGGLTLKEEFLLAVEHARQARWGITHIALIQGAGGMTDQIVADLPHLRRELGLEDEYLSIHIIPCLGGAREMQELLRKTGRLRDDKHNP